MSGRTRKVVESAKNKSQEALDAWQKKLDEKGFKKKYQTNPRWRALKAEVRKYARQITYIDKKGAKGEAPASGN